jgi:hypothetical protein
LAAAGCWAARGKKAEKAAIPKTIVLPLIESIFDASRCIGKCKIAVARPQSELIFLGKI